MASQLSKGIIRGFQDGKYTDEEALLCACDVGTVETNGSNCSLQALIGQQSSAPLCTTYNSNEDYIIAEWNTIIVFNTAVSIIDLV